MPDALWFSLPNSSPSHSVQDGLSVSLDSLNDNYTSGWDAQSRQTGSRLVATWRHVEHGNADLANSATAGPPVLWRWIKASMSAVGCDYMPTLSSYALFAVLCSIFTSHLCPICYFLSFATKVLLSRFLLSLTLFLYMLLLSPPSFFHSLLICSLLHNFPTSQPCTPPTMDSTSLKQDEHNSASTKPGPKTPELL